MNWLTSSEEGSVSPEQLGSQNQRLRMELRACRCPDLNSVCSGNWTVIIPGTFHPARCRLVITKQEFYSVRG